MRPRVIRGAELRLAQPRRDTCLTQSSTQLAERRRLGDGAREAVAGYDAGRMVERIDALYRELLAGRGLAEAGRVAGASPR